MKKTCKFCHNEYTAYHKTQQFCTTACGQHYRRNHLRGHPPRKWEKVPRTFVCEWCKGVFPAKPGRKPRFHDRECLYKYLASPNSPSWKGGRVATQGGYIAVMRKDHPKATRDGYVLEHRLVMEEKLGRLLRDDETVHHVDGIKSNNDPGNLQLRQGRHGKGSCYQCNVCGSRDVSPIQIGANPQVVNLE